MECEKKKQHRQYNLTWYDQKILGLCTQLSVYGLVTVHLARTNTTI